MNAALRYAATIAFLLAGGLASRGLLAERTWPQWRGPQRDGQFTGDAWPADLDDGSLKESWSVPLGPSYSGPIVAAERVFVTETRDKQLEVVRALDRATGKQLWEAQWEGSLKVPFFAAANGSWIRATPAYDGERLYVAGIRDVLVCLDAASGKVLWRVDFVAETGAPVPSFGFVCSPLVWGDDLYVQAGGGLAKLDKRTGKILWRSLQDDGGMSSSAFSSPVRATIAGTPQLVVQTRQQLAGVDPQDGSVLWSQKIEAFRGMNILTPTVIGDNVFTSSYGGRSTMLTVSRKGQRWSVETAWQHRSQGYMSSPVLIDGHLYLHLRNRRLVCLDAASGEERWTTTPFGKYWSMVANGGKLLALDQRGELLLIEASPEEFKLLARRRVADDSWAHLAVAGDELWVRDLAAIKRYVWK